MAAPSIARLFDHTLRVWRPAPSQDDVGFEARTYSVVAALLGCALNRSDAPVVDIGPGMLPVGSRRFYLEPDADVQARDVLELLSGPDAPGRWEINEPPTRPRGHHTQVDCIAWHGVLPAVVES